MHRFVVGNLLVASTVLVAAVARGAQPTPVGTQVDVATQATATPPAVAAAPSGDFVVTWTVPDFIYADLFARRFDATGVPLGPAFQVNAHTTAGVAYPAVATDAAGDFVVVWRSVQTEDADGGIFARRYDAAGIPLGAEFQVNTFTTGYQARPKVASDAAGGFVVAWASNGQDGSGWGVFAQRYDGTGATVGSEFQVNTYTTGLQAYPAVASDAAGNFLVVWESAGQDGSDRGIFAQRYDTGGVAQGPEFQVNSYTTGYQFHPVIAADGSGNFVVAWVTDGEDGSLRGIAARRYDGTGAALGGEFVVNTYTTGDQTYPAVATDSAGNFLVAWRWEGINQFPGQAANMYAQRFDNTGAPDGLEFRVNTQSMGNFGDDNGPAIAGDAAGDFAVIWTDPPHAYGQWYSSVAPSPQSVLGRNCFLYDSSGKRRIVCQALEHASDDAVVGNPILGGATLRLVANGASLSDQTFILPHGDRWSALLPSGYKYADPTGVNGPVRRARVKRASNGDFNVKALVVGSSPGLTVAPPNPGTDFTMALTIGGGAPYCVGFGAGHGGGTIRHNDAGHFGIVQPTTEGPCP